MSIDLGLHRVQALLKNTRIPWRAVHVAGTNGKGSVCAYVSRMLTAAGLKTGLFTSPHTIHRWDCIALNNTPISKSAFLPLESHFQALSKSQNINATPFELLTAAAFQFFTDSKVDIAVVEVGLGGRLDATNVIVNPLVSVITRIGLDHQSFLGNSLEEIAREKAGIIKPGVPVLLAPSNPDEVRRAVGPIAVANETQVFRGVSLELAPEKVTTGGEIVPEHVRHALVLLETLEQPPANTTRRVPTSLQRHLETLPAYRRENILLAWDAAHVALSRLGWISVDPKLQAEWCRILQGSYMPGRAQSLSVNRLTGRKREVFVDGAHNVQAATELRGEVGVRFRGWSRSEDGTRVEEVVGRRERVTWMLAFSSTKDIREILGLLVMPGDDVVTCQFGDVDGMPWVKAYLSDQVAEEVRAIGGVGDVVDCGGDVEGALKRAVELAGEGPMIVAGSLYLVGDLMRLLDSGGEVDGKEDNSI